MSEISIFLPPATIENMTPTHQEEAPEQKEIEKKKKKTPPNLSNKILKNNLFMGNNQNSKKIDTALYKKIFFNSFKEVCNLLFPQNKNFSNEKYQNFKNIYHKIYFYKRSHPERFKELLDEYNSTSKKANEIKKINHKNNLLKLLIQKIETQQNTAIFKQIAEELGRDVKADYIEKIYDSVDITEIKDFDKDKTIDNFFQRHQIKENNKKRTRKQMSSSPEKTNKSENSVKDTKKSPIKKQKYHSKIKPIIENQNQLNPERINEEAAEKFKSMFEFAMDNAQNSSFMTFQNSIKNGKQKNKDIGQLHFENASVNSDFSKTNNTNFLEGCLTNETVVDNVDPHETNLIKIANRNILSKLNKFCSYDFTQTNALIPHICIPNEKKQHHSALSLSSKQPHPIMAQEFLKKVVSYFISPKHQKIDKIKSSHDHAHSKMLNNESEDVISKHNFNSLSEENYPGNSINYPTNNPPTFCSDNQYGNPEKFIGNYQQIPIKIERNHKTMSFQDSIHNSHHSHSHSSQKIQLNPNEIPQVSHSTHDHKISHSKSHKHNKMGKNPQRNLEKNANFSANNESTFVKLNAQPTFEPNNRKEQSLVSKGMSFPPGNHNNLSKAESLSLPACPQQYFNIAPLDKDMQNNRRSVQIPQIYQAQPYRANAYFYNGPQDTNFMNNNVISTNNFCFQTGNNQFMGVNYPNMQNLAFTKPNNYQAFGVMELNNDGSNSQYGLNNYMNERSFGDKHRNGGEYWKQTYYPYNNQN